MGTACRVKRCARPLCPWGLGYKPSYNRSNSISAAAGRPPPKKLDRQRYLGARDPCAMRRLQSKFVTWRERHAYHPTYSWFRVLVFGWAVSCCVASVFFLTCLVLAARHPSSKIADVEDLPDVRMEASSPGPRVTFNIQDTVMTKRCRHATCLHLNPLFQVTGVHSHRSEHLIFQSHHVHRVECWVGLYMSISDWCFASSPLCACILVLQGKFANYELLFPLNANKSMFFVLNIFRFFDERPKNVTIPSLPHETDRPRGPHGGCF